MNLLPNEPVSIAKILDTSFKLFKASFKKTIGFGILFGLISVGFSIAGNFLIQGIDSSGMESGNMVLFSIIMFLGFLSFFWLYAAMIHRIDNVARQHDDTFTESLGVGLKKFPAMLLAVFLYSIAVGFGMVLLIIPGIILALSLFFYAYYIVLEDNSAYQSLKASHKLVWKDWWRTMGVFTVPGILMMVIYFAFGMLMAFTGINPNEISWVEITMNLFSGVFSMYLYVLGYVQYHDLKLRKSGSDLEARMVE